MALLALAAAASLPWLLHRSAGPPRPEPADPSPGPGSSLESTALEGGGPARIRTTQDERAVRDAPDPDTAASAPPNATGTAGAIRGRVADADGSPAPPGTRVRLEPAAALLGPQPGRSAVCEVDAEGRYAFTDLPLAGYAVTAVHPDRSSPTERMILRPGRTEVVLDLGLAHFARISGRVEDASGLLVERIRVGLDQVGSDASIRLEAETDSAGVYRFARVPDGDYRLSVGPPTAPAVDPIEVTVDGADRGLPPIVVPSMATLTLTVTDAIGRILPGIEVAGFGSEGGLIGATSDANGRIEATLLPPGLYRLRAADDRHGRGQVTVAINEGARRVEATLVLER
jgi:hypothetical protein